MSLNQDGARAGEVKGTKTIAFLTRFHEVKIRFSVSYSNMKYHQTVHTMANPFISSSRAKTFRGTWNHVFHRSRTTKRSWDITIAKRNSKNYINDVEIEVQRANTTSLEFGLQNDGIVNKNTIFSRIAIKRCWLVWFTT